MAIITFPVVSKTKAAEPRGEFCWNSNTGEIRVSTAEQKGNGEKIGSTFSEDRAIQIGRSYARSHGWTLRQ